MAHKPPADDKAARRAEALRANLRRRKSASRKASAAAPAAPPDLPAKGK